MLGCKSRELFECPASDCSQAKQTSCLPANSCTFLNAWITHRRCENLEIESCCRFGCGCGGGVVVEGGVEWGEDSLQHYIQCSGLRSVVAQLTPNFRSSFLEAELLGFQVPVQQIWFLVMGILFACSLFHSVRHSPQALAKLQLLSIGRSTTFNDLSLDAATKGKIVMPLSEEELQALHAAVSRNE